MCNTVGRCAWLIVDEPARMRIEFVQAGILGPDPEITGAVLYNFPHGIAADGVLSGLREIFLK